MKQRKLLAIDARPLVRGTGGIQRYLIEILPYLISEEKFEIVLYSDHPINVELSITIYSKVKIRSIKSRVARTATWHYWVCGWAAKDQPDIFWSPRHHLPLILPKKTRCVVTIHDFVWKTAPKTMPKTQLISEKILMPLALKKVDRIICISKTTQSQLARFFPKCKEKSSIIFHGKFEQKNLRKACEPDQPGYFLAVGTLEPRKNYERLIKAFDQYAENGGTKNLIIIGKKGWQCTPIFRSLRSTKNTNRVKILQNISNKELSDFYCKASGFISPSIDEGYGLPPQEASQYNLPLLLSDIEVYRELYSKTKLWVNPLSESEITQGLHQLEKLPRTEDSLSNKTKYTWENCSELLIQELY